MHFKANYYKPSKYVRHFGALLDRHGEEVDEIERGLTEQCPETKKGHEYLLLPFEEGQKQYLRCLSCNEVTHF